MYRERRVEEGDRGENGEEKGRPRRGKKGVVEVKEKGKADQCIGKRGSKVWEERRRRREN